MEDVYDDNRQFNMWKWNYDVAYFQILDLSWICFSDDFISLCFGIRSSRLIYSSWSGDDGKGMVPLVSITSGWVITTDTMVLFLWAPLGVVGAGWVNSSYSHDFEMGITRDCDSIFGNAIHI